MSSFFSTNFDASSIGDGPNLSGFDEVKISPLVIPLTLVPENFSGFVTSGSKSRRCTAGKKRRECSNGACERERGSCVPPEYYSGFYGEDNGESEDEDASFD